MKYSVVTVLLFFCLLSGQSLMTDSLLTVWRDSNVDFILFDVRGDEPVSEITVPCFYVSADQAVEQAQLLKQDKPVVVICHGGILAQNTAERIVDAGYPSHLLWYAGYNNLVSHRRQAADTLPSSLLYPSTTLPPTINGYALRAVMAGTRSVSVVDVRSAAEAENGMVPGACVLDWNSGSFKTAARNQCFARASEVLLYCASGNRAGQARRWLIDTLGFDSTKVFNLGGYASLWSNKGLPVVSAPTNSCVCLASEKVLSYLPDAMPVLSASPNPFNSSVLLRTNLLKNTNAELYIYGTNGKLVHKKTFGNGFPANGYFWNTKGTTSAGWYAVRVSVDGKTAGGKICYLP